MGMRILNVIVVTFFIAALYGVYVTTMDFMRPNFDPVASGHRAANNVYGLFGTVNSEIKRGGENSAEPVKTSTAYKVAKPYAVTADLSAMLGGKIENRIFTMAHKTQHSDNSNNAPVSR